jgi:hypothetical protein
VTPDQQPDIVVEIPDIVTDEGIETVVDLLVALIETTVRN